MIVVNSRARPVVGTVPGMLQPHATDTPTHPAPSTGDPPSPTACGRSTAAPAPEPAPEPEPNPGSKKRDPFFDNAKYPAIVLVAMGHSWEPLMHGSRATHALHMVVYIFHMPAFVIISGHFSRGFTARPEQIRRLITGVAVPYIVFETAYSLFGRWTGGSPGRPISLTDPWYLTWFLAAFFVWRLTVPIWRAVRWPLPLALVVVALATTSPSIGEDLDLQRVLQFLPYFVLGLCLKPGHFGIVRRRETRIVAVSVLAPAVAVAYWAVPRMSTGWLYHRDSAQQLGTG